MKGFVFYEKHRFYEAKHAFSFSMKKSFHDAKHIFPDLNISFVMENIGSLWKTYFCYGKQHFPMTNISFISQNMYFL